MAKKLDFWEKLKFNRLMNKGADESAALLLFDIVRFQPRKVVDAMHIAQEKGLTEKSGGAVRYLVALATLSETLKSDIVFQGSKEEAQSRINQRFSFIAPYAHHHNLFIQSYVLDQATNVVSLLRDGADLRKMPPVEDNDVLFFDILIPLANSPHQAVGVNAFHHLCRHAESAKKKHTALDIASSLIGRFDVEGRRGVVTSLQNLIGKDDPTNKQVINNLVSYAQADKEVVPSVIGGLNRIFQMKDQSLAGVAFETALSLCPKGQISSRGKIAFIEKRALFSLSKAAAEQNPDQYMAPALSIMEDMVDTLDDKLVKARMRSFLLSVPAQSASHAAHAQEVLHKMNVRDAHECLGHRIGAIVDDIVALSQEERKARDLGVAFKGSASQLAGTVYSALSEGQGNETQREILRKIAGIEVQPKPSEG